jgi:hypothetical protein
VGLAAPKTGSQQSPELNWGLSPRTSKAHRQPVAPNQWASTGRAAPGPWSVALRVAIAVSSRPRCALAPRFAHPPACSETVPSWEVTSRAAASSVKHIKLSITTISIVVICSSQFKLMTSSIRRAGHKTKRAASFEDGVRHFIGSTEVFRTKTERDHQETGVVKFGSLRRALLPS